jgi:hypothetical protein
VPAIALPDGHSGRRKHSDWLSGIDDQVLPELRD